MIYLYTNETEKRIVRISRGGRSKDLSSDSTYKEYIVHDDFDLSGTVGSEKLAGYITYDDLISRYNSDYAAKRTAAYPSVAEQMDMQYWDSVNGTSTWKDAIAKVKSDNPKS